MAPLGYSVQLMGDSRITQLAVQSHIVRSDNGPTGLRIDVITK